MRRFFLLSLAISLIILFPGKSNAWEVCETSVETLEVAGVIEFTSSFCNCSDGDMITIEITPEDPGVMIDSVIFTKATPHWQTNQSWAEQATVSFYTAEVILHKETEKTNTIHLWLYLSTEEHIGVNAQF